MPVGLSTLPGPLVNWKLDEGSGNYGLEADQGVTLDGSSKVSQWDDLSGAGNHLVQATTGKRYAERGE